MLIVNIMVNNNKRYYYAECIKGTSQQCSKRYCPLNNNLNSLSHCFCHSKQFLYHYSSIITRFNLTKTSLYSQSEWCYCLAKCYIIVYIYIRKVSNSKPYHIKWLKIFSILQYSNCLYKIYWGYWLTTLYCLCYK